MTTKPTKTSKQPRVEEARGAHVDTPVDAALREWAERCGRPETPDANAPRPSLADQLAAALALYRKGLSPTPEYNPMNSIEPAELMKRANQGDVTASRYLAGELADFIRVPRTPDPANHWLVQYFAPRLDGVAQGTASADESLLQPPGRKTIWRNIYRDGWLRAFAAIHEAHGASDADLYRWIQRHIGVKPSTARSAIGNPKTAPRVAGEQDEGE